MYPQPVNYPSIVSPVGITYQDDYAAGAHSGEWGVDEQRCNRTYTNRLKVFTSSKNCGALQVIMSLPIRPGDTYQFPLAGFATETDTGSFVQRIRAERDTEAGGLQWAVTIEYGPFDVAHQLGNGSIDQGIIDPTDMYPEVYFDSAKYRRSKPEDESTPDALPYVNSIGDPLLDVPDTEETRPVIKFVRNESTYNDAYASQFKDTVNSDVFLNYPPNTVKCRDIRGERAYDPDWGNYYRVTYEFEIRDDDDGFGYTQRILNAGYRQKVNGSGDPVNVVDASGNQVTDAVPLQQDGSYKPEADPHFLEFQEFPAVAFADLNIPDDLFYASL